jgi:hypothetical protein
MDHSQRVGTAPVTLLGRQQTQTPPTPPHQPPPKTKGVQCAVLSVQGSWSGVQWVLMIMCAVCSVDLGFQC